MRSRLGAAGVAALLLGFSSLLPPPPRAPMRLRGWGKQKKPMTKKKVKAKQKRTAQKKARQTQRKHRK